MKTHYNVKELAGLPGLPKTLSGLIRKAKDQNWDFRKQQGRGGGKEYPIDCLPQETRSHLAVKAINEQQAGQVSAKQVKLKETMTDVQIQAQQESGLIATTNIKGKAKLRMEAKTLVLNARRSYIQNSGLKASAGHLHFCMLYNENQIQIDEWVRDFIPSVHPATVYRWVTRLKTEGNSGLSGHYGKRKGTSKIETQAPLKEFTLGMLREFPHMSSALLHRAMQERFSDSELNLPGKRALERSSCIKTSKTH